MVAQGQRVSHIYPEHNQRLLFHSAHTDLQSQSPTFGPTICGSEVGQVKLFVRETNTVLSVSERTAMTKKGRVSY